jgi:integrase/recombinase XerD
MPDTPKSHPPAITPPAVTAVRLIRPMPIEDVVVVDALSGRTGSNRSPGHRQISADTDREAVMAWLARSADSPNTLANSRREAERLLLWALVEAGKPLSSLTHEDLLRYQHFLADPLPAERWIMVGRKLPRQHSQWRPFAGPLSPASVRQGLVVINSLFSWLVQAGYLAGNPLALARQRRAHSAPRVVRFLEEDLWTQVKLTIQAMPAVTTREVATQARARWLFSLLFLCGLRISEVVGNGMGGFFCRPDKAGEARWWLEVKGKGEKTRLVPATSELMVELTRYRRSLGLALVPIEHESTPLLMPVWWQAPRGPRATPLDVPNAMSRAAVHQVVKSVFERAAQNLQAQDPALAGRAERLRAASAHWLRHTAGSSMADQDVDLRHVRDTLGHASISTTNIYLHAEDNRRHQAIEAGHRLGWDSR